MMTARRRYIELDLQFKAPDDKVDDDGGMMVEVDVAMQIEDVGEKMRCDLPNALVKHRYPGDRVDHKRENVGRLKAGDAAQIVLAQGDLVSVVAVLAVERTREDVTADDEEDFNAATEVEKRDRDEAGNGMEQHRVEVVLHDLRKTMHQEDGSDGHEAEPIDLRNPTCTCGLSPQL
jgi:hypothetical protein